MVRKLKEYICVECDKIYIAKTRNYRHTCSNKCGLNRAWRSSQELHNKRGEFWDKWKEGILTAIIRRSQVQDEQHEQD